MPLNELSSTSGSDPASPDPEQAGIENAEKVRSRFAGRVSIDLANLYRVYCRLSELGKNAQDRALIDLADELLKIWDDISNTATIKVMANGFLDWIKTGCGPVEVVPAMDTPSMTEDPKLHSNLSDAEWAFVLDMATRRLDTGGDVEGVRRTLHALNTLMGIDPLERSVFIEGMMMIVNEAWHVD
jgi:hypothetical protein